MQRLDEVALREAKALAARQPRCDLITPWLPVLPSPPVATDLVAVYRAPETYSTPASDFIPVPVVPPPTYDSVVLATPGLLHYWPLNDASGSTTVADKKGSTNLALHGNVQLGAPPVCDDGETTARWLGTPVGGGLPVGVETDYIALPASVFPTSGPFTIELIVADGWMTGLITGAGVAICNGGLPSDTGWDLYSSGGGTPEYTVSGLSGGDYTAVYFLNARTAHWVLTCDGTSGSTAIRTYINGWWLTSNSQSDYGSMYNSAAGGYIGLRVDGTEPFIGRIGKVAIYDEVLTQAQIFQHYQTGVNQ